MDGRRKLERLHPSRDFLINDCETGQHLGTLGNMTVEGLMVMTGGRLEVNATYGFRIVFPKPILGQSHVDIEAKALWWNHRPEMNCYQTGFQIINICPEVRETLLSVLQSQDFQDSAVEIQKGKI